MTGLTRDQAREQIARAIYTDERKSAGDAVVDRMWNRAVKSDALTRRIYDQRADAALTVLWPVVEGLRAERDEWRKECADAVTLAERMAQEAESLRAELAHAHTVIARHVEPLRGAVIDRHCCDTCETKFLDAEVERTGNPSMRLMRYMVVCKACGSKRCPRAADHDLACEVEPRGEGEP